jgi:hypothetical protein
MSKSRSEGWSISLYDPVRTNMLTGITRGTDVRFGSQAPHAAIVEEIT